MSNFAIMKKFVTLLLLLLPMVCYAYEDHRGWNLDSLEREAAKWSWSRVEKAGREEVNEYVILVSQLSTAYSNLDLERSRYYALIQMRLGERFGGGNAVYRGALNVGQYYFHKEQYDSAVFYYGKAAGGIVMKEAAGAEAQTLDDDRSQFYGTLGNLYAMQDSLDLAFRYYAQADSIFVRNGWIESSSVLHYNLGEINMDANLVEPARAEYEQALQLATQAEDSLLVAKAQYGLGRYYQATGHTRKALEELAAACSYFEAHSLEETVGLKDTLAVMNAANEELYRNARMLAIGAFLVLLLTIGGTLLVRRLRLTRQELTETSAVLDETIEELRPEASGARVELNEREKDIARLLVEGKTTQEIAEAVHVGVNTVLWYRKRLYAKFGVHNAAAFSTEMSKRGLLE